MLSTAYQLAKADLLLWLSIAPDVAQGGEVLFVHRCTAYSVALAG